MSNPTFHRWLYQVVKWYLIKMRFFNYSAISILVPERITPKNQWLFFNYDKSHKMFYSHCRSYWSQFKSSPVLWLMWKFKGSVQLNTEQVRLSPGGIYACIHVLKSLWGNFCKVVSTIGKLYSLLCSLYRDGGRNLRLLLYLKTSAHENHICFLIIIINIWV